MDNGPFQIFDVFGSVSMKFTSICYHMLFNSYPQIWLDSGFYE